MWAPCILFKLYYSITETLKLCKFIFHYISLLSLYYPVERIRVWCDLFGVKKGAELRFMILEEQSEEMKWSSFLETVPTNSKRVFMKTSHNDKCMQSFKIYGTFKMYL